MKLHSLIHLLPFTQLFLQPALGFGKSKFRFKLDQLYEVSLGLEQSRGRVLGFCDFNSDRHEDIILLDSSNPKKETLQIWTWNNKAKNFEHLEKADIVGLQNAVKVIPGDFDEDGNMDLLVIEKRTKGDELSASLYLGNGVDSFGERKEAKDTMFSMPTVFDYDGDMRIDLLSTKSKKGDEVSAPPLWVWTSVTDNKDKDMGDSETFNTVPFALHNSSNADSPKVPCRTSTTIPGSFVDLNGDCRADLFLVCEGNEEYEIWTNTKHGFNYSQSGTLPSNTGAIVFADMNSDGSLDMVVSATGTSSIYIMYNKQRPLCLGKNKSECRKYKTLCDPYDDDSGSFGFSVTEAQIIDISDLWDGERHLSDTPIVRVADFNLDGFPDLLVITKRSRGKQTFLRLIESEHCAECKRGERKYSKVSEGVSALASLGKPTDVAVFDIGDGGTVDFLVSYVDANGKQRTSAIYNNFFTDAFFLKAMATPNNKKRSYGATLPGVSFKYVVIGDTGKKHVAVVQNDILSPYTMIGLGRTNNYLEEFVVGTGAQEGRYQRSFEALIPNSQVVVFPDNTTSEWRLELYMNKSEATPYIIGTLLVSMGILAAAVVALNVVEKRADQREKQRALHSINFDAL